MKSIKNSLIVLFAIMFSISSLANNNEKKKVATTEFEVSGVCEMCEKRIENAALIKGVKMADWNKETQKIKVVFLQEKTNELTIQKAIAEVGHDTEKVKATDEAYEKLHECCKYREQSTH